jgi:hypothetical protein
MCAARRQPRKLQQQRGTNSRRFKWPVYSARALNEEWLAITTADRNRKRQGWSD